MTDTLEYWEKWPIAALFGAQGLQIAEWYISKRMPEQVTGILPWVVTVGGVAAMIAIDGAMIAAVMGARAGRRGGWTWLAIGVTALFGALVALDLNGAIVGIGPWLHAGFAVTIAAYLMHLIQPRSLPTLSTPVNEPSSTTQTVNIAIVNPVNEPSLLVDDLDTTVNEPSTVLDGKRQQVKALVDSGMSITQAASTVGVSRQTASKYVKEV